MAVQMNLHVVRPLPAMLSIWCSIGNRTGVETWSALPILIKMFPSWKWILYQFFKILRMISWVIIDAPSWISLFETCPLWNCIEKAVLTQWRNLEQNIRHFFWHHFAFFIISYKIPQANSSYFVKYFPTIFPPSI